MDTTDNQDIARLIEEGRKRGYIRRAELEAALRKYACWSLELTSLCIP